MKPAPVLSLAALAVALSGASALPAADAAQPPAASTAVPTAVSTEVPTAAGAQPDARFGSAARTAALHQARRQAATVASALRLSRTEALVPRSVERDADGTEHLRYDRTVDGLRVIGGDLVVHIAPSGRLVGADYAAERSLAGIPGNAPAVSAHAATEQIAARQRLASGGVRDARLVVWAVSGVPRLAWETKVHGSDAGGNPVRRVEYVDASTGRHIAGWSLLEEADGTGRSLYSGTVPLKTTLAGGAFKLKDGTRGNGFVVDVKNQNDPPAGFLAGTLFSDADNSWGSGTTASRQSAAVDAAYGTARTWDFYQTTFGRAGIRGDGVGARSRVHYSTALDNAFWNDACFCMTYGDGGRFLKPVVSLDVAGHEMTHGVTTHTANLIYRGESGGLNEATSDIFGTMVEFGAGNVNDRGDYYIGEKVVKPTFGAPALRRMDQPSSDGSSFDCWSDGIGESDVHFTSGPGNHFFYLLAEGTAAKTFAGLPHRGTTCNASGFTGIGRAAAAAIWFRALTVYMTTTTNYVDARDATIRAARDLFPTTPARCAAVVRAWEAVTVPAGASTCSG